MTTQDNGAFHDGPTGRRAGTPTGRFLVLMQQGAADKGMRTLERAAGISVSAQESSDNRRFLPELGIAITEMEPGQVRELGIAAAAEPSGIVALERERYVQALEPSAPAARGAGAAGVNRTSEYWVGFRDGTTSAIDQFLNGGAQAGPVVSAASPNWQDDSRATWGLHATLVAGCNWTGKGVRVAVLDTGIALNHADFVGRVAVHASFVTAEPVEDRQGHGTHCCGTVAGPKQPNQPPRYGCAPDAELYVGKVLNNRGEGRDGDILAGIAWAVNQNCAIISMSLGGPVEPNTPYSVVFETAAYRAMTQGCLIVAAAGNDSSRPGSQRPVAHPANCPSILAVGAVDLQEGIAPFSNAGGMLSGSGVDLVGPGVAVLSSYAGSEGPYRRLRGTSMATPHVAGIAALWAQKTGTRGQDLWEQLIRGCRYIDGPASDFGAGMVQAPSA